MHTCFTSNFHPEVCQSFKEVCQGCAQCSCCGLSAGCLPSTGIRPAGKARLDKVANYNKKHIHNCFTTNFPGYLYYPIVP